MILEREKRIAGVRPDDFNVAIDRAERADLHAIHDFDLIRERDSAADEAVGADLRASRHAEAFGRDSVFSDAAVVTNMSLVVEDDAVVDDGVFECSAIHGGAGAEVNFVADDHAPLMRNSIVVELGIVSVAETFFANDVGAVNLTVGADCGVRADEGEREDHGVGADFCVCVDVHVRAKCRALGDFDLRFNHAIGTDFSCRMYFGARVDDGGRVNAGASLGDGRSGADEVVNADRHGAFGLGGNDEAGVGPLGHEALGEFAMHDKALGLAVEAFFEGFWCREECEILGGGARGALNTLKCALAMNFKGELWGLGFEPRCKFAELNRASGE